MTIRGLLLSVVVAVLLSSCGPSGATTGNSSATLAPASQPTKIVVSYSNAVALELPVWSAFEGGFFQKHGLDVDLRLLESSQGMAALIAGEIQFSDIAGGPMLDAVAAGVDVVDIAEYGPVYPYVFLVAPDIATINDLKGKKVGVSSIGSASDIATRVALRNQGLDPDRDVAIVTVGSATARTAALVNGSIQGGVQLPPDQLVLESKGFHVLFDMADLKLPNSNTTEIVLRGYLNSHRDVVQKYVDSLVDAAGRVRGDRAFAISVLKKYFKSEDDQTMGVAYDYVTSKIIPSLPYPRPEQLQDARDELAKRNEKVREIDLNKVIDASFVQSAADRGLDKASSATN